MSAGWIDITVLLENGLATRPGGPELMLQADYGPVAFRNIHVRPLKPLVER